MATEQAQRQWGAVLGVLAAPFLAWPLTLMLPDLLAPVVVLALAIVPWAGATGLRRAICTGLILGSLLTLAYYYFVVHGLASFD